MAYSNRQTEQLPTVAGAVSSLFESNRKDIVPAKLIDVVVLSIAGVLELELAGQDRCCSSGS